ncbi:hypothetical protein EV361DRAFT_874898, partial [Lentinula raphanica]
MSGNQPVKGRLKFNVSLATLSLPGVQSYHFKTYKHPDIVPNPPKDSPTESEALTPQQEARKRYEQRNIVQRRERARERMANFFRRRAQNREGEREKQRVYEEKYRQRHRDERRYQEDRRRSL